MGRRRRSLGHLQAADPYTDKRQHEKQIAYQQLAELEQTVRSKRK